MAITSDWKSTPCLHPVPVDLLLATRAHLCETRIFSLRTDERRYTEYFRVDEKGKPMVSAIIMTAKVLQRLGIAVGSQRPAREMPCDTRVHTLLIDTVTYFVSG